MHCDTVRAALLGYLNDETGSVRAWAIRRHLAACAGCAQELAAQRRFTATLRRADLVPPLSAPVAVPARRVPLRRAFAATGAVLLVLGLFLLPTLYQSRRNAQNPGAAVAAALARVNTWHFSGWKLIDGRQVPWEVWGRRSPWLYYERVGDTTTWSDGKQRLRVFAPDPALRRPHGLVVKTIPDQVSGDLGFLGDPAYQSFVNDQRARTDSTRFGDWSTKLYAQTPSLARFRSQDAASGPILGVNVNRLYTVSKRDWLPTTYQRHFDSRAFARDTEYLGVRYDVDLPDSVVNPPTPNGYSVVDFTQPAIQMAKTGDHISGSHGFQVQAEPVGMDEEGNVLIVVRGWLGGNRLTPDSAFSLDVSPFGSPAAGQRQNRNFKYVYGSHASAPPSEEVYLTYTPLEPSEVVGSLPDTFHQTLWASPQVLVRSSDRLDEDGRTQPVTQSESLVTETFRWALPLPSKPVPSLLALVPANQRRNFQALGQLPGETQQRLPAQAFECNLAEQRRAYYFVGDDYSYIALEQAAPQLARTGALTPEGMLNPAVDGLDKVEAVRKHHPEVFKKAEQEFRAHSVYWQQRKLELLPTGGATAGERFVLRQRRIVELQLLAICYQKAGDPAGRVRALRELLRESRAQPAFAGFRRQAEYSLYTGKFPGDLDYKGPS